jgi:HlyD family secretion protein
MADASILFLPAGMSGDTIESLHAEHGAPRAWVHWWVLAGVAGSIGCLPLIDVDVSVHAAGMIRPLTERADVRASVSGHIAQVLVRDNDRVQAGQALLVLTSGDLDERVARNCELQAGRAGLISDLRRLTALSSDPAADESPTQRLAAVRSVAGFATAVLQREHAQLIAQLGSNQLDETKARTEYDRYATLAAKGIASRSDLDRARYEVERLQAEAGLIVQQSLARWQLRLRDEEIALGDLASEEKRLREEKGHFTIHAPVEGMLIGFNGWSVGGFISSGQSLGTVSPNDELLVEALVSSRDIGLVSIGQPAKIAVDAYPYTQWGMLDGTVVSVSGDSLGAGGPSEASSAVFKVAVRPAVAALRLASGIRGELRKGLAVQARFLVARRSLLQLLSDDISSWLDPRRGNAGAHS